MSIPPEFPNATDFRTRTVIANGPETAGVVEVTFKIDDQIYDYTGYPIVTPQELADHISNLYESRGWPAMTFNGRPAEMPVN